MLTTLGVSVGALIALGGMSWMQTGVAGESVYCPAPEVLDGDTLDCGSQRIRLDGIDAPELPGHCRPGRDCAPGDPFASTASLRQLVSAGLCQVNSRWSRKP